MKPDARRAQLLDCGEALFFGKGFDATTMEDILAAAGVSKGGFYHHFESKDALLFGILDRMAGQIAEELTQITRDSSLPVLTRIRAVLGRRGEFLDQSNLGTRVEVFCSMNRPENCLLRERFMALKQDLLQPILSRLFTEGVAEGALRMTDIAAGTEMVLHVMRALDPAFVRAIDLRGTDKAPAAAAHLRAMIALQCDVLDHILGLPKGSIDFGWPARIEALMALPVQP